MSQTRIGFIGAGIIANRHLGNLLGFPDVAVVALADPATTNGQILWSEDVLHPELERRGWLR